MIMKLLSLFESLESFRATRAQPRNEGELKMIGVTSRNLSIRVIATAALVGILVALSTTMSLANEEMASDAGPPGTLEFVGKNLIMKANGVFHDWRVVESAVDMAALGEAFAVVEVDLNSVDTGIEKRDDHLRTPDFFDTETYPVAMVRVHSAQPVPASEDDKSDDQQRYVVQFDVDLHGVQKTVEGEVVVVTTDPLVFEGNVVIDRMEFGIGQKWNWWSAVTPKEKIPVRFHVEF